MARAYLLLVVLALLPLITSCGKSGVESQPPLVLSEIKVVVGRPGAEKAALYILEIANTGEKAVRDVGGELYLLDILTGEHMVLSSSIREIQSKSKEAMLWELPSNSAIGKEWQEKQMDEFSRRQTYATSHAPAVQVYLITGKKYLRVDSERYTLYYTVPDKPDGLQPVRIEVNPSSVIKFFQDYGVSLPESAILPQYPTPIAPTSTQHELDATEAVVHGNWSKAIQSARQWAAADQENPIPHFILNVSYTYSGAREQLKAEIPLAYGTPDRVKRVKAWAQTLADKNSNLPCAQQLAGLASEVAGETSSAIQHYQKAIRIDPRFKQAYEALGTLYLSNQQLDQALQTYSKILSFIPNDPDAHIHIANVYIMKDDVKTATTYMKKGVELDPFDAVAYYNLAMAYLQQGLTEEAKKMFLKVTQLDPAGEVGRDAKKRLETLGS